VYRVSRRVFNDASPALKAIGDDYESRAARFLEAQGLDVLTRNFRRKTGEIDIIARGPDNLVFVEVRARSSRFYESAAASVDHHKRRRIMRTAQLFLQSNAQLASLPCRFDVIAFEPRQSGAGLAIRWIPGAFTT
jgi:putative endonuclease